MSELKKAALRMVGPVGDLVEMANTDEKVNRAEFHSIVRRLYSAMVELCAEVEADERRLIATREAMGERLVMW